MYKVWHVDKYKITLKLFINRWTYEIVVNDICYTDVIQAFWAFRHIQDYYSPRNISTIKYLFMKNAYKTKMTNSGEPLATRIIDAAGRRLRNAALE